MQVKAIDNLSLMNFEGGIKKRQNKKVSYPQMDAPASQSSSKAMRNLILGLMALGATASCTKVDIEYDEPPTAEAYATSWAWACGGVAKNDTTVIRDTINHRDTTINTVIEPRTFKEYPFHIADSLIRQGLNIGIPLEGPEPKDVNNNVVFLAAKAHNRYDNKFYEIHAQDKGTNGEVLTTITKCLDLYDSKHPKTQWIKTEVDDLPGEGIRLTRYVSNSEADPNKNTRWNYAGYEVRTNNRNGRTNSIKIYDKDDRLVGERKGEYLRGQEAGTFMFGTVCYDDDGYPFIDPDDGQVVWTYYDFDQAKMWSEKVNLAEVPDSVSTYYYGTH